MTYVSRGNPHDKAAATEGGLTDVMTSKSKRKGKPRMAVERRCQRREDYIKRP